MADWWRGAYATVGYEDRCSARKLNGISRAFVGGKANASAGGVDSRLAIDQFLLFCLGGFGGHASTPILFWHVSVSPSAVVFSREFRDA